LEDIGQGTGPGSRLAGRTQSMQEAEVLASQYESRGFTATIRRISQSGLTVYEVWVSRKPDVFSAGR